MPYITSVERIGFERGRQEGERLLLQRQLVGKFGTLPEHLNTAVEALSSESIESLAILILRGYAIALLNFSSLDDLASWLTQQKDSK